MDAIQQTANGAVTVGYYLQYVLAPVILAAIVPVRAKVNRFLGDVSAIRTLMEKYDADISARK